MSTLRSHMLLTAAALAVGMSVGGVACSADGQTTVNIGIASLTSMIWAPHHAADGRGLLTKELKKEDASYEVTEFSGGSALFAAMSAGDVDLAFVPTSTVAALNKKSRGLQCVMMLSKGGSHILLGAKKYEQDRGKDLAAYDGGSWAYSSEGSTAPKTDEIVLKSAGAKWSDQHGLALGSTTAAAPALESGRADIVTVDSSTADQILDKGSGYVVLNTNDPSDRRFPYPDTGTCIAASTKYVEKHGDEIAAVVRAELQGLELVKKNVRDAGAVISLFPEKKDGKAWSRREWSLVAPAFATLTGIPTKSTIAETKGLAEAQFGFTISEQTVSSSFTKKVITDAYSSLGLEPEARGSG